MGCSCPPGAVRTLILTIVGDGRGCGDLGHLSSFTGRTSVIHRNEAVHSAVMVLLWQVSEALRGSGREGGSDVS